MNEERETLKALSEAATPGEWKLIWHGNETYPYPLSITGDDGQFWIARDGTTSKKANGAFIVALVNAYRSGKLVDAEPLLALLAEAREAIIPLRDELGMRGVSELYRPMRNSRATLSRIDAALAAEPEARG
jgi:hypothetical protein